MRLGLVLRRYRLMSDVSQQTLAGEIGISKATLSRVERGEAMDGGTLARVLRWLMSGERGAGKKP